MGGPFLKRNGPALHVPVRFRMKSVAYALLFPTRYKT